MLIVLGILAVAALGGIIYLFISPKSSKIQKTAALGALILSGLAFLICVIIVILNMAGGQTDPYAFPPAVEGPQPTTRGTNTEMLIFLLLLLLVFGIIVFIGIRDHKKRQSLKSDVNKTATKKTVSDEVNSFDDSDFDFDES